MRCRHLLVGGGVTLFLVLSVCWTGAPILELAAAAPTVTPTGVPSPAVVHTPVPVISFGTAGSPPTVPRERVVRLAMQAATSSAPEIGILEARVEAITADLLGRDEADRWRGPGGLGPEVTQVWWVATRGYFRYQGMPAPGMKPTIYEAAERVFLYDATTGRPLSALIAHSRPVAASSPTPDPAPPPPAAVPPAGAKSAATQAGPPPLPARIAFERAGDIYLLHTATGSELRLTDDARNRAPRWASDGRSLFFAKSPPPERDHQPITSATPQAWRWRTGSGVERVADGMRSPDGIALATVERAQGVDQTQVVWVEQGVHRAPITPAESGVRWQPLAWSPDGRRLALSRYRPELHVMKDGSFAHEPATLWVTEGDFFAGVRRQLPMPPTFRGQSGVTDVAWWSPDGRFVTVGVGPASPCASCRADGLPFYAVPADGGPPIELGSAVSATGAPSWALGSAFAVLSVPFGRETYRDKHLARVDPSTGTRSSLAADPRYADLEPAVSPDGRLVAYARGWAQVNGVPQGPVAPDLHPNVATIASRRLWLVGADGSSPHRLQDEPGWTDEAPVWTADGAWLMFVRWRPAADATPVLAELWAVRPDGSGAKRLISELARYEIGSGFGYYGAFRWRELFAAAPD